MANRSSIPWTFQNVSGTIDLKLDILAPVAWIRPFKGRKLPMLCEGEEVTTTLGLQKKRGRFSFRVENDTDRDFVLGKFLEAAASINEAYFIFKPTDGSMPVTNVVFDPDVSIEEQWQSGARVIVCGFKEA